MSNKSWKGNINNILISSTMQHLPPIYNRRSQYFFNFKIHIINTPSSNSFHPRPLLSLLEMNIGVNDDGEIYTWALRASHVGLRIARIGTTTGRTIVDPCANPTSATGLLWANRGCPTVVLRLLCRWAMVGSDGLPLCLCYPRGTSP